MSGVPRLNQKQREQELAEIVQVALARLLARLDPEERKTTRSHGSPPPLTFEDKARAIAESERDPRAKDVGAALHAFQEAVNAFWVFAIQCELPEKLTSTWTRKHRADAANLQHSDLEAEVVFALRYQIIRYCAGTDASLESFASRGVHQHLTEWMAQQGPVELPQRVARMERPRKYREPINDDSTSWEEGISGGETHVSESLVGEDPEDYLNAVIDGDISEGDL